MNSDFEVNNNNSDILDMNSDFEVNNNNSDILDFQKEKLEALTIRISTQLKNKLKKKAEKEDLSLSQILRKLIKEYLS